MNGWVVLGVSVFGGLGALARFVQDTYVKARVRSSFPWGTVSINVAGSLLLGLIAGLAMFTGEGAHWKIVLGTGFCAGYTTFSTAMFDVVSLVRQGRWWAAAADLVGTLLLAVAAVAAGIWLAALING